MIKLFLQEMRLKQWIKNIVVLLPAVFANQILSWTNLEKLFFGFLIYSLVASSLYIFNDILDIEKDRLHPEKKYRPIASGKIPVPLAVIIGVFLMIGSLTTGFFLSANLFWVLVTYVILILLYSFKLKKIPIFDMISISIGFVLRIIGGSLLIDVAPSNWIIITTFFFALFFVTAKRQLELRILEGETKNHRAVLDEYSYDFLNIILAVTATMAIVSYSIYTLEESVVSRLGTESLIYTVPFVFIFISRMVYIAVDGKNSAMTSDPTNIVVKDRVIFLSAICWLIGVLAAILLK